VEAPEVEMTIEDLDIQVEEALTSASPPDSPPPLPVHEALEVNGEAIVSTEDVSAPGMSGPEDVDEWHPAPDEPTEMEFLADGAANQGSADELDWDRFQTRQEGHEARVVLVARIPDRRLRLPSETRWIREQLGLQSYGFTVGQNIWVGTIVTKELEEAKAIAVQTKERMIARYGDDFRAEWTQVEENFEIDTSSVLPTVVEGLIHYLSL
jgi:hypothetical protein